MSRWMEMATWWLPKSENDGSPENAAPSEPAPDRESAPATNPEPDAEPAPEAAAAEAAAPAEPEAATATATATASDDLTAIRGIGPAMQKRLVAMGIRTHADLAAADADTLTERLKADKAVVSRAQIERWIESAGS
ncbi:DUF4332 domain-containing protein [Spiribacter vilamensis]|nr:DUF4332 domain-containing protein [Spiribacter vilamensis]TVO60157.1 DUF4332 domain-containing protein [Spiribacter vilamensis]